MSVSTVFWQYNVGLVRSREGAQSAAPFEALFATEGELRGELAGWFFMRKRPDVRLRVNASRAFHERLEDGLRAHLRCGRISSLSRVSYEPQTGLFGGPWGMSLAHAQFQCDSQAWWRLIELQAQGVALDWSALSGALLNDLFAGALESVDEVWEVWRRLAALRPDGVADPEPPRTLAAVCAHQRPEVVAIVEQLTASNRAAARDLTQLYLGGHLTCGQRALLGNLAQFHLNRWGIRQASALIASMVHYLDPNLDLAAIHAVAPAGEHPCAYR